MNKTERYYRLIEKFCETKFKGQDVRCEIFNHSQSNGFYMNQKKYFIGDTLILYEIERPTDYKIAFDYSFFREVKSYIPVRGYRQFVRRWLFENKFKDFIHKDKLSKKFSYYG